MCVFFFVGGGGRVRLGFGVLLELRVSGSISVLRVFVWVLWVWERFGA